MLDRLRGKLIEKNYGKILVETGGGLGLRLLAPLTTALALPDPGTEVILHTRLVLRQESVELFGFLTKLERESFDVLTSVSRIGPRLALTIISALEPGELALALMNQDISRLSTIKGIGTKTAERILVELKDKAGRLWELQEGKDGAPPPPPSGATGSAFAEAVLALQTLGYSKAEAEKAVKSAAAESGSGAGIETLIKTALKTLGRQ
ncbi:MAG: Holliday junction branch migration protein RuvA [Deltaproteobacteria bacterium]|jgi:Holliday junction DNA helicase RuvA|nr:Holliday junction branch migration protein RuvA [Deltaproteobacteria bacterium]